MRSISEYLDILKQQKTHGHDTSYNDLYDDIDLSILLECQNKFQDEYYSTYKIYGNIFEAHGIFDKARDFAKFISDFIINFIDDYEDHNIMFMCNDIKELKNNYFNIIYINFDGNFTNGINGEYDLSDFEIRFIDNKFDYIVINLNKNIDKEKIYKTVEHELTHAYEDYKRHINNVDNLLYKTIKSKYHLLEKTDNDDTFTSQVKDILYFLDDSERNAYIAEFDGILGNTEYNNIQDAFNKIYDSKLYKQIKEFSVIIDSDNELILQKLCEAYRNIYKVKYSDKKILSYIKDKWNIFWNKFRNHIYQCVCDHIKSYITRQHVDLEYQKEQIENMKKYINKSIFIE